MRWFKMITLEKRKRIRDKIWKLIFNEHVHGGDIEIIFNELIDDWKKIGDFKLRFFGVCGIPNSYSATQCE